jgi:hypothetical protein
VSLPEDADEPGWDLDAWGGRSTVGETLGALVDWGPLQPVARAAEEQDRRRRSGEEMLRQKARTDAWREPYDRLALSLEPFVSAERAGEI